MYIIKWLTEHIDTFIPVINLYHHLLSRGIRLLYPVTLQLPRILKVTHVIINEVIQSNINREVRLLEPHHPIIHLFFLLLHGQLDIFSADHEPLGPVNFVLANLLILYLLFLDIWYLFE